MPFLWQIEEGNSRGRAQVIHAETKNFENNIKKYAQWKQDNKLLATITAIDFTAKEVKYHVCRLRYQKDAEQITGMQEELKQSNESFSKDYWHMESEVHQNAFDALCYYIQDTVIENQGVLFLTDVNRYYQALIHEYGGNDFNEAKPTNQKLSDKLKNYYKDKINLAKCGSNNEGYVVYSTTMPVEEAIKKHSRNLKSMSLEAKVRKVAFLLRDAIMVAETRELPENLTIDDTSKGEVDVPEIVSQFIEDLVCGPDSQRRKGEMKQKRVKCISQDLVFVTTSGRKKPRKHLQLGLVLKSLTGSRKVIELLNRMGYCASYHTTQEIETEMTFEAGRRKKNTPFGMSLQSNAGTGVAWDNYDRFVETQSGKDTLHDTVGITYQMVRDDGIQLAFEADSTEYIIELDYEDNLFSCFNPSDF